jgi:hypothetical protein
MRERASLWRQKHPLLQKQKGMFILNNLFLLPVVPDVLHIVVIFHDVDELFHQGHVVLRGNHVQAKLFMIFSMLLIASFYLCKKQNN